MNVCLNFRVGTHRSDLAQARNQSTSICDIAVMRDILFHESLAKVSTKVLSMLGLCSMPFFLWNLKQIAANQIPSQFSDDRGIVGPGRWPTTSDICQSYGHCHRE